jgi:hypothetical protein
VLNPLWNAKGYASPDEFKKFCNTVVPLARLKQRVFTTTDKLEVPVEIANFGPSAIANPVVRWSIRDANGGGKAAREALADGKKILFTPRLADLSWWSPPLARVPIFWNALMGPTWSRMLGLWCDTNSPALAGFPTEANCDWQWTEIIAKSRAVNLGSLRGGLKPIVSAIDDWNRNYKLGVIFEARVGQGKLLVCTADLNSQPVGQQLRRSLLDYMAGEKLAPNTTNQANWFQHQPGRRPKDDFQPATEISFAEFDGLFFDNLVMKKLHCQPIAIESGAILRGIT